MPSYLCKFLLWKKCWSDNILSGPFHIFIYYFVIINTCIIFLALHNKVPQIRWLKQWKFIFSRFWKLEVWDQRARNFGFWWGSSWLTDGCLLAVSSHGLSSACVHRELSAVSASSSRDSSAVVLYLYPYNLRYLWLPP